MPSTPPQGESLALYASMAEALLEAYRTGTPEAMERHYRYTWHRRVWPAMRTYVQLDLGKRPLVPGGDVEITIDDARHLIAIEYGFASWAALIAFTQSGAPGARTAAKPVRLVDLDADEDSIPIVETRDWGHVLARLAAQPRAGLAACGQMTDEVLADVARLATVTALDLSGSQAVTDEGIRHLARLPQLQRLDLSGTAVTDRGMAALAQLVALETVSLAGTRVTDAGVAELARCDALQRVNLSWTRTGDGALRALAGKRFLRILETGNEVTDGGLALLHELPVFTTWQGGSVPMRLFDRDARPNVLSLRGSFTDRGMQQLRGLDGLFALDIGDTRLTLTAAAVTPLQSLPNLGWLSAEATDEWMAPIAALPALRYLSAQDTAASDEGFVALSQSRTIECIWGRRCHNLRRRGFHALATMPALRGLSVSCLNVEDAGVAALPEFPALVELMPMDVPDAGYRHIGRCERLESLILMYCRDTTDAATEHLVGLRHLTSYFNSYTTITDRTPEVLSGIESLERITFDACHGLTDAGVARLARLPRLRELRVAGHGLTPDVARAFRPQVRVFHH